MRRNALVVLAPVMTAITVVLSLMPALPLPLGGRITLQTLGVMLAGLVLGAAGGSLSQLLLVLLVAVGAPVASGGHGGLAVFAGPTGGYLIGFIPGALVAGLIAGKGPLTFTRALIATLVGGVGVVYLFGIPGTALSLHIPLSVAAKGALAYIPLDLVKAVMAAVIALPVRRALAATGLFASSNRPVA